MEIINMLLVTSSKSLAKQMLKNFENHQAVNVKTSNKFNYGYDLYIIDDVQKMNVEAIYLINGLNESNKIPPGDFIVKPINFTMLEILIYQKLFLNHKDLTELDQILKGLGLSSHLRGYEYIKTVIYIMKNKKYKYLQDAYKEASKQFKVSYKTVEKEIRATITNGWINANYKIVDEIFVNSLGYASDKPTNKQFIYAILNIL